MFLVSQLQSLLGADAVLTEASDMAAYVEDWRGRYRGDACCVVLPSSTAQVAAVVRAAHEHGVPVVPQGGNTSLCEGAVPRRGEAPAVLMNLARMRRIRALDVANNSIEVEAGCVLQAVQQAAAEQGRLYPVSLGAEGSCQIGGNIATNAGGTGVLRYGTTRDNVLGLEVVLPDGTVWDGLTRLRKNNTGLDLKHLFIGAEGTMGIVTAAVLKLHPLPTVHAAAWLAVPSPRAALQVLGLFQDHCGAQLSAFEMLDAGQVQLVLDHVPGRRAPLPTSHPWHVLVELADTRDEAALSQRLQQVLEAGVAAAWVDDAVVATSGAQRQAMWAVRHGIAEANRKAGIALTTDSAVPVSALPDFIEQASAAVRSIVPDLPIVMVAHLGDGNVHFIPFFSHARWQAQPDRDALGLRIKRTVNEVCHALGGSFSAEHGVGQMFTSEMAHFKSPVELALMRAVKQAVDPAGVFNPGRLLPPA